MRIEFIELANFRKLRCIRVGLAIDKTVFVGANNSGKTSTMVALRRFLLTRERKRFSLNDFTLSHWPAMDAMGHEWEKAQAEEKEIPKPKVDSFLPFLDLWLHVEPGEEHYVQKIIPTLEWSPGLLGLRLRLEPEDPDKLQMDYLAVRTAVKTAQSGAADKSQKDESGAITEVSLWPECLTKFLERSLDAYFIVRKAHVPDQRSDPFGHPRLQRDEAAAMGHRL